MHTSSSGIPFISSSSFSRILSHLNHSRGSVEGKLAQALLASRPTFDCPLQLCNAARQLWQLATQAISL